MKWGQSEEMHADVPGEQLLVLHIGRHHARVTAVDGASAQGAAVCTQARPQCSSGAEGQLKIRVFC